MILDFAQIDDGESGGGEQSLAELQLRRIPSAIIEPADSQVPFVEGPVLTVARPTFNQDWNPGDSSTRPRSGLLDRALDMLVGRDDEGGATALDLTTVPETRYAAPDETAVMDATIERAYWQMFGRGLTDEDRANARLMGNLRDEVRAGGEAGLILSLSQWGEFKQRADGIIQAAYRDIFGRELTDEDRADVRLMTNLRDYVRIGGDAALRRDLAGWGEAKARVSSWPVAIETQGALVPAIQVPGELAPFNDGTVNLDAGGDDSAPPLGKLLAAGVGLLLLLV